MNGRLPAGQQGMPQDIGRQDMGRRRQYNPGLQHQHQQPQQQYQPNAQMYNNPYMNPYNTTYYPQALPPQYQNIANNPYQPQYAPYPPHPQQFAHPPMPQQPFSRPQPSPAPIYQAPPPPPPPPLPQAAHGPTAPQTPPSTHSSYAPTVPTTPATPEVVSSTIVASTPAITSPIPPQGHRTPFLAPVPWYSTPDDPWPKRRPRRKKKEASPDLTLNLVDAAKSPSSGTEIQKIEDSSVGESQTPVGSVSGETESTSPTTASSQHQFADDEANALHPVKLPSSSTPTKPVVPVLPKIINVDPRPALGNSQLDTDHEKSTDTALASNPIASESTNGQVEEAKIEVAAAPPLKAWSTPKVWSGVFTSAQRSNPPVTNGAQGNTDALSGKPSAESLADALKSFSATSHEAKVAFLEPRGLVNTDQCGKRSAHSFKSETPLIDAMIMFMREYRIIGSASSAEQLKSHLKDAELEKYGDAFTPNFVYDVMKRLPRFVHMEQGHQQDAEEFLGFLLDGLHEECVHVIRTNASTGTSAAASPANRPGSPVDDNASNSGSVTGQDGWLEVGPKQKAAVTRSSGTIAIDSPLTKIFGGKLRSELKVQGQKDSITLEPFQPLQLDIGAPTVNNIIDALRGLTKPEAVDGAFTSRDGSKGLATKQVFIETLPPVLILHLKRFHYGNAGAEKIWKKVGYPLELEIPKELFPRSQRAVYAHGGLPKYRLISVVYHHGNTASGGHYTVDVRRQDGQEWIRLDDTSITRLQAEKVADSGKDTPRKVTTADSYENNKNPFAAMDDELENGNGNEWKQAPVSGKKGSSGTNGATTPKAKNDKFSMADNKVAYLLFYQRI